MDTLGQHMNHMLDNLEKLYDKISSFSRELELEVANEATWHNIASSVNWTDVRLEK